jgi:phosphoenolpyruvate carboxykinase (ATP)
LEVPRHVPDGVPSAVLLPRATWSDPGAYDAQAARLAELFRRNFAQFAPTVHPAVRAAGPPPA